MMPASQLNLDNLRNVDQALVVYNSFDILPAIKHFRFDRRFFPERILKIYL